MKTEVIIFSCVILSLIAFSLMHIYKSNQTLFEIKNKKDPEPTERIKSLFIFMDKYQDWSVADNFKFNSKFKRYTHCLGNISIIKFMDHTNAVLLCYHANQSKKEFRQDLSIQEQDDLGNKLIELDANLEDLKLEKELKAERNLRFSLN